MKRFLIAVLGAAVAFATVANAATLVATAPNAASGGTVTITLVGTTDPESETAQSIDVRIVGAGFTSVSAETATGGVCVGGSGCIPGAAYSVGGTQGTTVGGNFVALSQIGGLAAVPLTNNMTAGVPFNTGGSSLTAVFTTIAGAPGTYPITLSSIGAGFFGVTGTTQIGSYTVVPEPTTAALMGLGMLGLAMAGRRR
jgi:hypothetical protein